MLKTIRRILKEELLKESGIRGMRELAKRYPKAKIYFHQDLDGVTTAIGMKNYLEQHIQNNRIENHEGLFFFLNCWRGSPPLPACAIAFARQESTETSSCTWF